MSKPNIISYLHIGEENAVTGKELCKLLGLTYRELTFQIRELRIKGEVICSSGVGYWLPSNVDEVRHFCRHMTSRQNEIERAKQSAQKYIERHR